MGCARFLLPWTREIPAGNKERRPQRARWDRWERWPDLPRWRWRLRPWLPERRGSAAFHAPPSCCGLFFGENSLKSPQAELLRPLRRWQRSRGELMVFYPALRRPRALGTEVVAQAGRGQPRCFPAAAARLTGTCTMPGPPGPGGEAGGLVSSGRGENSPGLSIWLVTRRPGQRGEGPQRCSGGPCSRRRLLSGKKKPTQARVNSLIFRSGVSPLKSRLRSAAARRGSCQAARGGRSSVTRRKVLQGERSRLGRGTGEGTDARTHSDAEKPPPGSLRL